MNKCNVKIITVYALLCGVFAYEKFVDVAYVEVSSQSEVFPYLFQSTLYFAYITQGLGEISCTRVFLRSCREKVFSPPFNEFLALCFASSIEFFLELTLLNFILIISIWIVKEITSWSEVFS